MSETFCHVSELFVSGQWEFYAHVGDDTFKFSSRPIAKPYVS